MPRYGEFVSGLKGIPPNPTNGGMPGPFKAGGNDKETGDAIGKTLDVVGTD